MKIFLKLIWVVSFFIALGLLIAKLGLVSPEWEYPTSFLGWVVLIIVIILFDLVSGAIGEKIKEKYGPMFWEKFSEKEVKIINKSIIIGLVAIVITAILFGTIL